MADIHEIPNPARDEMTAAFTSAARMWIVMTAHADQIAVTRRRMFVAYVEAGFTEAQALELCKAMTL